MGQLAQTQTTLTPTKPGSITVDNWKDLLFLVREPNRKGEPKWFIRAIMGEFAQVRYGPYDMEKEARAMFEEGRKLFDQALGKALCEFDHGGEWEE